MGILVLKLQVRTRSESFVSGQMMSLQGLLHPEKGGMGAQRFKMIRRSWILIFLLLLMGSAGAEGVIPPDFWAKETAAPTAGFSFRGGIAWNMSKEQVRSTEKIELTDRSNGNWSILYPLERVEVSRYQADLVYMFHEDRLKMITYDFGNAGTAADFAYLSGALDSVYGEHTEPDASVVVTIMDQIYPGYYTAERIHEIRGWSSGEDTWLYLYYYAENAYGILYVSADSAPAAGNYVTTGL